MSTVAIICAKDEAPRIGRVVETVVASGIPTLVIDDGSSDLTAAIAREAGANVLSLPRNVGKGRAMQIGATASTWLSGTHACPEDGDSVLFVDADLQGLRPDHLHKIVQPMSAGNWSMVVGLRDYGPLKNPVMSQMPLISGERAVRRDVLNKMPHEAWDGYGVETWLNHVAHARGPIGMFVMDGVTNVRKWDKEPDLQVGLDRDLRMATEIARAHVGAAAHVQQAPAPPGFRAASGQVTRELCRSMVEAGGPFVRDHMWTPEVQRRVGEAAGRRLSLPLWCLCCAACTLLLGPLGGLTAAATGLWVNRR